MRLGRRSIANQAYLLTSVTLGRRRVFDDFWLGCLCCRTLTQATLWRDARLLAWVLMPDHLHLLVALHEGGTLPKLMQRIKGATSLEVGRATRTSGLWQAGYHDHALRADENVRAAARYVIANPVRGGLVKRIADYPFWDAVWVLGGGNPLEP